MGPAAIGDLGTLIFTYGTLKRGFCNNVLLRDLIDSGDAAYLGDYQTAEKLPLVCGPYRVPFHLNLPGSGDRVWGELYAVSARALARMDELEGTTRGHYERLPITLLRQGYGEDPMEVEAYYTHRSYAAELWKRSGEKGYSCYREIESSGYIRRKDRPQHLSFLDQISFFIRHNPSDACCKIRLRTNRKEEQCRACSTVDIGWT